MFQRAFTMFTPFTKREEQATDTAPSPRTAPTDNGNDEIDDLKRQMEEMQRRLERLGKKD